MSRKHSTLLKEEIDEEEEGSGSGGDKKKREKDKDGVERKKKTHKKGGTDRSEGYDNDSMMKSAMPKTTTISSAAVNPSAEMVTSPIHSQPPAVIPPPLQPPPPSHQSHRHHVVQQNNSVAAQASSVKGYIMQGVQGQVNIQQMPGVQQIHNQQAAAGQWQKQVPTQRLPPPPGAQHVQMVQQPFPQMQSSHPSHPQQMQTPQPSYPQAQFAHQSQHPQQQVQYHAHPSQQGYYTVVQYPHGVTGAPNQMPAQVVAYPGHPMVQHPGIVLAQAVPDDRGSAWHPVAPQSPTNQGQIQHEPVWPKHAEGNWTGHPTGTTDPNWHPDMMAAQDQQREGGWAAFDGSPAAESKTQTHVRKEITWRESPDNSSSDEEIERVSSPELVGEEGEGLLRAPSLTSFAESTSSVEEEVEENPWKIQPEQEDYYTKQFKKLQPDDGGVIKGPKARDFFLKSSLPTEILSRIWHLSDINQDNALDLEEFCIAMHLVVALRHGLELPSVLPDVLLYHKCQSMDNNDFPGDRASPLQDNARHENMDTVHEDHSISNPVTFRKVKEVSSDYRPRSLSDPSINEEHQSDVSRKTSMPSSTVSKLAPDGTLSPGPTVSIERPRAVAKFSLLDAQPGQLLPPPSGKFAGWTPTKADKRGSYSGESDEDSDDEGEEEEEEESRSMSPGQAIPVTVQMPSVQEGSSPESPPTPPASPQPRSPEPEPVLPDTEQVTRRLSKRSERPRSDGDLNEVKPLGNDSDAGSTPTNSSIGSDGKKEPPPPPPPRNKKGHSRSSSLDLNKLFASKGKEGRANTIGSPSSSTSSQNSHNSDDSVSVKTGQKKAEENGKIRKSKEEVAEEENFADFSNFETLVKAQGTGSVNQMNVTSQGRTHRRSLSLDHEQDYLPKNTKQLNNEVVVKANNGPSKVQEALPRPVPKLKPPGSPPVKLLKRYDRTPRKEGSEERKLKTEPPKVIVKPLTKKGKFQNSIRDLKDKNLLLSRLNSELQQENKEAMEQRIGLELQLERLKPFSSK